MEWRISDAIIPAVVAVTGVVLIGAWISGRPPQFEVRVPGLDQSQAAQQVQEALPPPKPGEPVAGAGEPSQLPGSWPCFRGPNHDGVSSGSTRLARQWPESGPPELWRVTLGEGYAGAAVSDGRVFVLDYDEQEQDRGITINTASASMVHNFEEKEYLINLDDFIYSLAILRGMVLIKSENNKNFVLIKDNSLITAIRSILENEANATE